MGAKASDTTRTIAFTGRPCRVMKTPYVLGWEKRPEEVRALTEQGKIPWLEEVNAGKAQPSEFFPSLMGQVAGAIKDVKPAKAIVDEMLMEAQQIFAGAGRSKL